MAMEENTKHVDNKTNTLFVRNLPYSTTNEKLEALFSEVGPVRQCFVVKDKGSEKCKGFGYVKFALFEDAEAARSKVTSLDGRKLFISFADRKIKRKRPQKKENKKEKENSENEDVTEEEMPLKKVLPDTNKSNKSCLSWQEEKYLQAKTLVIEGFSKETSPNEVEDLLKKLNVKNIAKVMLAADRKSTILVRFKSIRDLTKAQRKINGKDIKGTTLKANQMTRERKSIAATKSQKMLKKGRLIVRNLSFKCSEDKLKETFEKYGEVTEVVIPKLKDGRVQGFGIVQFSEVGDAANALKTMNTKMILGRPVAVDWAVPKNKFETIVRDGPGEKNKVSGQAKKGNKNSDTVKQKNVQDTDTDESSVKSDEEGTEMTSDSGGDDPSESDMEEKEEDDEDDDSSDDEEDHSDDEEDLSDDEDVDSDVESNEINNSDSSLEAKVKKKGHFDTVLVVGKVTLKDNGMVTLKDKITRAGVRLKNTFICHSSIMCDICGQINVKPSDKNPFYKTIKATQNNTKPLSGNMDHQNDGLNMRKSDVEEGRTLFVRNVPFDADEESLEEVFANFGDLNYVRIVMNQKTDQPKGTAFVQFKSQQDVEKCIAASQDEQDGIFMDGRKLDVMVAINRDKAKGLSESKKKVKEDRRNLHLVREGMIRPGTQAAIGLSKEDLAKRSKLEMVKRQKLKDPNIFISTTRLSVHNIPTQVDDKQLKQIFLKAAGNKSAVINECRIMRDLKRVNSKNMGKSRGYAFVNFMEHEHALSALQNTNNNPDIFTDKKRLIVEFSLENKAALEAKEKRLERQKLRNASLKKKDDKEEINQSDKVSKKDKKEKLVDKYIGKIPVQEDRRKLPKGLPSHWGTKVRHKPRPEVKSFGKKSKKGGNKRKAETVHQEREKQIKKRKTEKSDNFDKLVNKYKQNLLKNSDKSKWFDR